MKIGLTGTMSVGKSTLVHALKELPEFKDYFFATERSKYLRDLGIPLNTDSTLKGQTIQSIHDEDKIAFTNYAAPFIWEYDYIFYVSPVGVEIEDNGVRETDADYRKLIDISIKNTITENLNNIQNFGIISGTTEERIKQIKSYLGF